MLLSKLTARLHGAPLQVAQLFLSQKQIWITTDVLPAKNITALSAGAYTM